MPTLFPTTPILIIPDRPGARPCRCTWSAFCRDNADAFTSAEFAEIAATIAQPFVSYPLAGGAHPQFFVAVAP